LIDPANQFPAFRGRLLEPQDRVTVPCRKVFIETAIRRIVAMRLISQRWTIEGDIPARPRETVNRAPDLRLIEDMLTSPEVRHEVKFKRAIDGQIEVGGPCRAPIAIDSYHGCDDCRFAPPHIS
jgi:hypothetical protein